MMNWLEAAAKILSPIRPQRVRMAPKILDTADTLRGGPSSAGDFALSERKHFSNPAQLGHVRGSTYETPQGISVLLDEIQSDPLSGKLDVPELRGIYGKLGKAMVDRSAEAGATELLTQNAKRITDVRDSSKAKFYQDIYDKTLEKDLYQPLSEQGIPVSLDNGYWRIGLPEDVRNSIKDESGILNYAEGGSVRSSPSVIDLIRNDPELQALPKNILKSLLNFGRGSVAALGGIGGDMTALGGTLLGNEVTGHGDTFLPTTSDLLRRLPQLPDDWKDYEVQQAGTFDPGIVPTALPKLGGAMARLGAEAIHQGTHGAGPLRDILRAAAPLSVIKPKGGNWLAGSVEDALHGLKRNQSSLPLEVLRPEEQAIQRINAPINQWIEGPLTKYVKTRMASPDDEVRKLAEEGVLHYEPAMIRERSPLMEKVVGRREAAGFPIQGIADAPLARNWENTSDSIIRNLEALDLSATERAATFGGKTVPKETIVHELNPFASGAGISDLGFNHLIDELSNALNPNSGLPRNLQLTPEAVQNMSMEKAVRRVADINAFRAAQQAEANRKLAEQASLVREYAKNNPKGLRWVELTAPSKLPEGYQVRNEGQYGFRVYGPDGKEVSRGSQPSEASAVEAIIKHPEGQFAKDLRDQLKYEGDTMGHCVGGYCDDVLSGRSRIFSLRDAKGEPHVTVEVAPPDLRPLKSNYFRAHNTPWDAITDDAVRSWYQEAGLAPPQPKIVQIKGKQNRKPNDEYLPFVQDFVRNSPLGQPWSHVGDIQHTDLVTIPKGKTVTMDGRRVTLPEGYQSLESLRNLLSHPDIHPELSDAQAEALYNEYLRGNNYAEGGSVSKNSLSVADLGRIIEQLSRSQ